MIKYKNRIEYSLTIIALSKNFSFPDCYRVIDIPHGLALINASTDIILCKVENNQFYAGHIHWGTSEKFAVNAFMYGLDIPLDVIDDMNIRGRTAYFDIATQTIKRVENNTIIRKLNPRITRLFDGTIKYGKGLK